MDNELFSILFDATKESYQSFIHTVWTALGAVMVAIGWILTSRDARQFISSNENLKLTLIIIVLIFLVVHISVIIWHKLKSNSILDMLSRTDFSKSIKPDENVLELYSIPGIWVITTSVMNGALILVLAYLLYKI